MTLKKSDIEGLQGLLQTTQTFWGEAYDWVAALDCRDFLGQIESFQQSIEAKIEVLENDYWTFERDGTIFDHDFDSEAEAVTEAEEGLAQECEDESRYKNGETVRVEIVLINFKRDDNGERVEISRRNENIEWECYHGDAAEHGTYHKGGVL